MAKGRMISRGLAVDYEFNRMPAEAMLLYLLTIPHLDRDGLITGRPASLAALVAPMQRRYAAEEIVLGCIAEWLTAGFVVRYAVKGRDVLFFKGFRKNNIGLEYRNEPVSLFPPPPGYQRGAEGLVPEDAEERAALAACFKATSGYRQSLLAWQPAGSRAEAGAGPAAGGSTRGATAGTGRGRRSRKEALPETETAAGEVEVPAGEPVEEPASALTGIADAELDAYVMLLDSELAVGWTDLEKTLGVMVRSEREQLLLWLHHYQRVGFGTVKSTRAAIVRAHMNKGEGAPQVRGKQQRELKQAIWDCRYVDGWAG